MVYKYKAAQRVMERTMLFSFCYGITGKRAGVSHDGKQLPLPVDTHSTRGVISGLSASGVLLIDIELEKPTLYGELVR